ncbi:MAG: M6 family metalloprotease domain-containing protein [Bacteroidales bacterium]|nr:M6 family metalloprotease domain-containing protein [Candidatus Colicola faecequi]
MKKIILAYFALLMGVTSAFAVIATPDPVSVQMPDGSTMTVRLNGDEFASWYTTLDGELLMRNNAGFLVPADDNYTAGHEARVEQATSIRKAAAAARNSYVPSRGHVRIPVVLVNFTDRQFVLENVVQKFNDLYNGNGGSNPRATGSVHNYYIASSDSTLFLDYDVLGPYTLSHDMAYYGANVGDDNTPKASNLVREAAQLAYAAGVDLSVYDNNHDGYVDNLSVVVAGYNEAEGGPDNTIWPHYSQLYTPVTVGNVRVSPYLMISELRGGSGTTQAGIGTYSHEFGHALGLPDFYCTERGCRSYTIGEWSIMCSGSYNNNGCTPPSFTAFERFAMGWLVPEQLTEAGTYSLEAIETSNKAYLIAEGTHNLIGTSPSPSEYFLVENRQRVGWDATSQYALVGTGMMISHITWNDTKWAYNTFNNTTPLGFDIVEAVAKTPSQSQESDLFPGPGNVTSYVPVNNSGSSLKEHQLLNIMQLADGRISFRYGESTDEGFWFSPDECPVLSTAYDGGTRIVIDTLHLQITGKNLKDENVKIYLTSSNFSFSPDGGTTWYNGNSSAGEFLDKAKSDHTYSREVLVICRPSRQNCGQLKGNLVVTAEDDSDINQLMIYGTAPRPVYITTPVPVGEDALSGTSFTAVWEEQEDADSYFVALYTITEIASTEIQSFESFATPADRAQIGWEAENINMYTAAVSSGKYSVQFTTTGGYVMSEEYASPVSEVSFWLSNNYTTDASGETPGGTLLLEATSDGRTWDKIATVNVVRTTKGTVKEYILPEGSAYVRFRISYTHKSGKGGVLLDDFIAGLDRSINYIHRASENEVYAPSSSLIFSNLTPGQTYYWQVQAYEDKGCEPHYTSLSAPRAVTTSGGGNASKRTELQVLRSSAGEYTLQLLLPSDGLTAVNIYTSDGRLVSSVVPTYGSTRVPLPTDGLLANTVYYVKLCNGRMKRQADFAKFVYY